MSSFTDRAMSAEVSPELFAASLEAIGELPADQRGSFEGRAFRLFRLLEERDEADEAALNAFAIQLRLEALARLQAGRDALVITDCETCKWQIEMSTAFRCEHPIHLLAQALA